MDFEADPSSKEKTLIQKTSFFCSISKSIKFS